MSRCYPYPPPGYEKKPQLIKLVSSPKKDERKRKNKDKKRRRKDSETNGDSSHRDKDKRSRSHQHGGIDEGIRLANGRPLSSTEPKDSTSVSVHGKVIIQRQQTDLSRDVVLPDGLPTIHKGTEPDRKVGTQLSSIPPARGISNGSFVSNDVVLIKPGSQIEGELNARKQEAKVEKVWSAIDDEEWLSLCKPPDQKRDVEEGERLEVWAEVVYLPSVGIHALPYVVPD